MEPVANTQLYRVWGADKVVYGPCELKTLVQWLKAGQLTAHTWVLLEASNQWQKAVAVAELREAFASFGSLTTTLGEAFSGETASYIEPASLRRIKLFSGLDN